MSKLANKIFQLTIGLCIVIVAVACVVITLPKYRLANSLSKEHDRLLRCIEEKNREIAAVREKQRRFQSDREFVESLARENRRVFPGELVFIFDN